MLDYIATYEGANRLREQVSSQRHRELREATIEWLRTEAQVLEYADHQTMLLEELNHRVRNNLSSRLGLLQLQEQRGEAGGQPVGYVRADEMTQRIRALAAAHDVLSKHQHGKVSVQDLAREVIAGVLSVGMKLIHGIVTDTLRGNIRLSNENGAVSLITFAVGIDA